MTQADARRICDDGYEALEAGRFDVARPLLEQACSLAPDDALVHFRIALLHVDTGKPGAALAALDRSLALDPANARAHNNRGSALELLGRMGEAEEAFRCAIGLDPDLAQPYLNLGHVLEARGATADAIALYEQALARGLDAERFRHQLAAAAGETTTRAPDDWVRATFDNFAPTFDSRLAALGYDAPRALASMLQGRVQPPCDILDLGCGTGQCGLALADVKGRLVGVDLSPKMLASRRRTASYDELHAGEVNAWLPGGRDASFDVVVAGDVFIYIGALEGIFRDVARVLRPHGVFAFSIEEHDGAPAHVAIDRALCALARLHHRACTCRLHGDFRQIVRDSHRGGCADTGQALRPAQASAA